MWAYSGILLKHISANGFGGKYHEIIVTVVVSLIIVLLSIIYVGFKKTLKPYYFK